MDETDKPVKEKDFTSKIERASDNISLVAFTAVWSETNFAGIRLFNKLCPARSHSISPVKVYTHTAVAK